MDGRRPREKYRTIAHAYPSSMSDEEWALIVPYFPSFRGRAAAHGLQRGKDMFHPMRLIINAIFYVLRSGITWRALPQDFRRGRRSIIGFGASPGRRHSSGSTPSSSHATGRKPERDAQPTAGIIDSQTVKATEAPAPRDYDGGKKITGLKRHALVDVEGRILILGFSTARAHNSVGGSALMKAARRQCPFIELYWTNSAYRGPAVEAAAAPARVEVVSGLVGQKGFVVQKRRWVVERSFAWFNRSRRLWRVCEVVRETISAMAYAASVFLLMRRIARRNA